MVRWIERKFFVDSNFENRPNADGKMSSSQQFICVFVVASTLQFETDEKPFDSSLLAFDCFHMSQKGHG